MSNITTVKTGYVEVVGGRLYYEEVGAGQPLLLVHADVADCRMWDAQLAAFAHHYRVIRYDKRGFGKTTSEDVAFSHRQDIVALLNHLGIEKTAILGLSNGGRLALDFTLEHPGRVEALIVVAGGISGYDVPPTEDEMELIKQYTELEQRQDTAGLIALGLQVWVDGPGQPEGRAAASVREQVREMMADNERLHKEQFQPAELEPPAIERLSEVRVPTLVVIGGLDVPGTNATLDLLAERVAGAQKIVFPDTAHMVNMEQPERFNAAVLEFLSRR